MMKRQNLVLVKETIKNSKSEIYKWVSRSTAENIINNSTNDDVTYKYASWYISLFYKLKRMLFVYLK